MTREEKRLVYIYAEYCPGVFYWGWWLYSAPITDGQVRRDDRGWDGCEWLHKMEWKLDSLNRAVGLPVLHDYRGTNTTACTEAFLEKYPNGVVLWEVEGREFESPADSDDVPSAWRCLQQVREAQLLDWRESDDSYLDRHEDSIKAQLTAPVDVPALLSALSASRAEAEEMKRQRDGLGDEMERCHRMLDVHWGLSLDMTAVDTLEERLQWLLEEMSAGAPPRLTSEGGRG